LVLPTAPTAAALLAAWEVGAAAAPIDRAPSLLRSLGAVPSDLSVERLTVGQCDARLFALRREMFGDTLDAVSTCPACATEVQMAVALDRVQRGADGRALAAGELPYEIAGIVIDALAANDPGAQTAIAVRCPCGAEWADELDIRSITWADLTAWVGRTLTEVHQLAHAYGWSEADILAMSATRRRWYLEAAGW
jgi:hypothetical protein